MKFSLDLSLNRKTHWVMMEEYNQKIPRPEGQRTGAVKGRFNNIQVVADTLHTIYKEFHRGKVSRRGVLKITRSYLARAVRKSEPTIDLILEKLQKLGIILNREISSCRFFGRSKRTTCLSLKLNLFLFYDAKGEPLMDGFAPKPIYESSNTNVAKDQKKEEEKIWKEKFMRDFGKFFSGQIEPG